MISLPLAAGALATLVAVSHVASAGTTRYRGKRVAVVWSPAIRFSQLSVFTGAPSERNGVVASR